MVERLNGTVRERNKVMRGLKDEKTASTIIMNWLSEKGYLNKGGKVD